MDYYESKTGTGTWLYGSGGSSTYNTYMDRFNRPILVKWSPGIGANPASRPMLEDARSRAVAAFGPDHSLVHAGVALEMLAASFCGASSREVMELAEKRIPPAERALGWRHRAVTVAMQNYAEEAMNSGERDKSISTFQTALQRETATRGENNGMAQWICGNLALASPRCGATAWMCSPSARTGSGGSNRADRWPCSTGTPNSSSSP